MSFDPSQYFGMGKQLIGNDPGSLMAQYGKYLSDMAHQKAQYDQQQQIADYQAPKFFDINQQVLAPLTEPADKVYGKAINESLSTREKFSPDNIFRDNKGKSYKYITDPSSKQTYIQPINNSPTPQQIGEEVLGNRTPQGGMDGNQQNYLNKMQELKAKSLADEELKMHDLAGNFNGTYVPEKKMFHIPANQMLGQLLLGSYEKRQSDLGDIYRGAMNIPPPRITQQAFEPRAAGSNKTPNPLAGLQQFMANNKVDMITSLTDPKSKDQAAAAKAIADVWISTQVRPEAAINAFNKKYSPDWMKQMMGGPINSSPPASPNKESGLPDDATGEVSTQKSTGKKIYKTKDGKWKTL